MLVSQAARFAPGTAAVLGFDSPVCRDATGSARSSSEWQSLTGGVFATASGKKTKTARKFVAGSRRAPHRFVPDTVLLMRLRKHRGS